MFLFNDAGNNTRTIAGAPQTLDNADWPAAVGDIVTLATPAKGAALSSAAAGDGVLKVHPIGNEPTKWYLLELVAGQSNGAVIFDKIDIGIDTTVDLGETTLFVDPAIAFLP
jgi:hypothetical protein